jgi:hypothetical protein
VIVFGIDPGTTESAIVAWDGTRVLHSAQMLNENMLLWLDRILPDDGPFGDVQKMVAIEWIESFGMAVGREVFWTCLWVGRFYERAGVDVVSLVTRREVKMHICGSMKAKDANIRQALIDRFGGTGTKKNPGPLRDIASHRWSALAVAATWHDTKDLVKPALGSERTKEF